MCKRRLWIFFVVVDDVRVMYYFFLLMDLYTELIHRPKLSTSTSFESIVLVTDKNDHQNYSNVRCTAFIIVIELKLKNQMLKKPIIVHL